MSPDARDLRIEDFDYPLPDDRIARYPLPDREQARLLQYRGGEITGHHFTDLPPLLPPGTLLIGNRTRVIHARLHFPLPDGRPLEIFCLEPLRPVDYALSLGSREPVEWKCLVGGNRRWKSGSVEGQIELSGKSVTLRAERGEREDNTFRMRFSWTGGASFGEVLDAAGSIPLPPYLGRAAEEADRRRYQTVFAEQEGSVAAPTAGLHFTPAILERLETAGIAFRTLTLHVGAGTFKPVTADQLGGHIMHREFFSVTPALLYTLADQLEAGRPVVSIGTTSMRCLESLFYFGARILEGEEAGDTLDQWVAGDPRYSEMAPAPALRALANQLEMDGRKSFEGYTQLLLTPGGKPRVVDGLITNFHQPRSTLLLLVASMLGDDWQRVYAYALEHGFRFLSYGDSSLLWRVDGRWRGAE